MIWEIDLSNRYQIEKKRLHSQRSILEIDKEVRRDFYKARERIRIPYDYYEEIKKSIAVEFAGKYVERIMCEATMGNLFSHINEIGERVSAIEARLDKMGVHEEGEIELVEIPEEEATSRIVEYIKENPGCRTSDIIFNLHLDPNLVLKVLKNLGDQQKIRGEPVV